jgi:hypothetical protein
MDRKAKVKYTKREAEVLEFLQKNVIWKKPPTTDLIVKMVAKATRWYDPMESYGPRRYPR